MAEDASKPPLVAVLGAGVVGLTVAATLALRGAARVVVLGESTPSEPQHDRNYTSPKAGANWMSFAADDELDQQRWDGATFRVAHGLLSTRREKTHVTRFPLVEIKRKDAVAAPGTTDPYKGARHTDPEAGIHLPWFKTLCPGFRLLTPSELKEHGAEAGFTCETVCFDSPRYLLFLQRLVESLGGTVASCERVSHYEELLKGHQTLGGEVPGALFICTGIGSRTLGGIEDQNVYPTRGQVVIVRGPEIRATSSWISEFTYVIPRGDGTVILGGTYQADNWNVSPEEETTAKILAGTANLPSSLAHPGLKDAEFLYSHAGLRPTRNGGIRIEMLPPVGTTKIVTCYGHGGYGYQSSWGSCLDAANVWLESQGAPKMDEAELTSLLEAALEGLK